MASRGRIKGNNKENAQVGRKQIEVSDILVIGMKRSPIVGFSVQKTSEKSRTIGKGEDKWVIWSGFSRQSYLFFVWKNEEKLSRERF
jgi:hypothetical protein